MSRFILAADPVRPWTTLLSSSNPFSLGANDDRTFILEGSVSGLPATIELYGRGFGTGGSNLATGTAQVNAVQYTVAGQVVMRADDIVITGSQLVNWIARGSGEAFEQAVFLGDDVVLLSNGTETQNGYSGNDLMNGRAGNDTLRGDAGNDSLYGGEGDDLLYGDDGNDLIVGSRGDDSVQGGLGLDVFLNATLRKQVLLGGTSAAVTLTGPEGIDSATGVERLAFVDGVLHLDPGGAAGQVWRLYGAAFGRDAEATGLSNWVAAIDAGAATLNDAARGFIGSAEFAGRYGLPDNASFVTSLYANVLGRAPDAPGLETWTALLTSGVSRAEVLLGFSESVEYRAATIGSTSRLWTVDPEAMDVLRAYATILNRIPDAEGLSFWTVSRHDGLTNADMLDGFIHSSEFQSRFGALSNEDFVARLYPIALDRTADEAGHAYWTSALDNGAMQRRDVVQGFAYSDEMTGKLLPLVSDGIAFA